MVAADSACQTCRNSNDHQLAAGENRADDGQQHTESTPGGTGCKRQTHSNQEYNSGQQVCHTAGIDADKFCNEDLSAQIVGNTGQGPCKGQNQDCGNHLSEALSEGLGELLDGNNLAGDVEAESNDQRQEGAQNQTHGSIGAAECLDEVHVSTGIHIKETAGVNHGHDAADDQGNDGQQQIHNGTVGISGILLFICVGTLSGGVQVAVHSIDFMLTHHAKINVHHADHNDHCQRHQCIEVIGNGLDEQLQTLALGSNTGNSSCPGGDGSNDTDRSCGSIDQVCQLCAGNLVLVGDRAHNRADSQAVEVVIDEDQHTQQCSGDQSALAALDVLLRPATVSRGAACLVNQTDHHTQHNQEDQNANIPRVSQLADHHIKGIGDHAPDIEVGVQECTGENADEQGGINFLGDQRQCDCDDGRQQRNESCIAANILTNHGQRIGNIGLEVSIAADIFFVAFQIAQCFTGICKFGSAGGHCEAGQQSHCHNQQQTGSCDSLHFVFVLSF